MHVLHVTAKLGGIKATDALTQRRNNMHLYGVILHVHQHYFYRQ